jgi:hypothetical protein
MMPAMVLSCGSYFLPETPNSLLEHGKDAQARKILVKIRGTMQVDNEFDDIKIAALQAMSVRGFYCPPVQFRARSAVHPLDMPGMALRSLCSPYSLRPLSPAPGRLKACVSFLPLNTWQGAVVPVPVCGASATLINSWHIGYCIGVLSGHSSLVTAHPRQVLT